MQQQWKDAYPGLLGKLLTTAMLAVGRNVEQGSFSALYAATSPEIEERGGMGITLATWHSRGRSRRRRRIRCWGPRCGI